MYTAWILSFYYVSYSSQQQLAAPAWTMVFPTAVVCLFFAAPILYGSLNAMTAANTAQFDSLCTVQDKYSKAKPSFGKTARGFDQNNKNRSEDIPEICDLDVAVINDLIAADIGATQKND
jgi:hypothetical protein